MVNISAFDRLKALGEGKFTKIKNELMRGIPAQAVARLVQQEWGDFQDVAEKTLTQQINRLRLAMLKGALGPEEAKKIESIAIEKEAVPKPLLRVINKVATIDVLQRMEELLDIQRERVLRLHDKEKNMPIPMVALNVIVTDYGKLLQDLQKMRFDLGLDEFKGPVGSVKAMSGSVTLPDGTNIQQSVYEAVDIVEKIFEKRGIQ